MPLVTATQEEAEEFLAGCTTSEIHAFFNEQFRGVAVPQLVIATIDALIDDRADLLNRISTAVNTLEGIRD